jgi:carbamoylphosphate synthase small subunit
MNTNQVSKESITIIDNSHMLQIVSVDFGFKLNELEDVLASKCSRSRLTLRRKIVGNKAINGDI